VHVVEYILPRYTLPPADKKEIGAWVRAVLKGGNVEVGERGGGGMYLNTRFSFEALLVLCCCCNFGTDA